MRSFPIALALLLALPLRIAAQAELDSLTALLATAKEDTIKVDLLNELASGYSRIEPDKTIAYGTQAAALAQRLGYPAGLAEAQKCIGFGHMWKEEYAIALTFFTRALSMWETLGNLERQGNLHNLMGYVAQQQSDFPEALKQHLSEMRIVELSGDTNAIASLTSTIGSVYDMMDNWEESIKRQLEAIQLFERAGNRLGVAQASNNLGSTYDKLGRYDEGLKFLTQALDIARELKQPMGEAICLGSIANHYQRMGDLQHALQYQMQALPLFEQMGDVFNEAATRINVGETLVGLKRYPEAREHLEKGLALATAIGAKQWIANAHGGLTDLFEKQGDSKQALEHYRLNIAYKDSITNDENTRKSVQVQMQYDFDKKEAVAKAEQEKKDALSAEEIQRKELQRNALMGFGAFGLVFAVVDMRRRRRIKQEHARSEALLLNILPEEVAKELKDTGAAQAKHFDTATILFTDFKGFTQLSEQVTPAELVEELNTCFKAFDEMMGRYRIEKIKTIGDAYMAAGGLPDSKHGSAADVVRAALEMQEFMQKHKAEREEAGMPFFEMRVGIHTGPVVAGIVGVKKFQYDIWGDTVNTASRMESSGEVDQVNISEATYALVKNETGLTFTPRGKVQAKGKGELEMYFVARA